MTFGAAQVGAASECHVLSFDLTFFFSVRPLTGCRDYPSHFLLGHEQPTNRHGAPLSRTTRSPFLR